MKHRLRQIKQRWKNQRAFTLIEMVIVLFIIAVLLLIIIPNVGDTKNSAQSQGDEALIKTIETQAVLYETNTDQPASVQALGAAGYLDEDQVARAQEIGYEVGQ